MGGGGLFSALRDFFLSPPLAPHALTHAPFPPRAHCSFTILAKGLLGSPSMELLPEMALPAEVEEEEGAKGGAAAAAAADEEEL